jgi:TatD DNase family protein
MYIKKNKFNLSKDVFYDFHCHVDLSTVGTRCLVNKRLAYSKELPPVANGLYSIGLHPYDVLLLLSHLNNKDVFFELMEDFITRYPVFAIGECGLDSRLLCEVPLSTQLEVLGWHYELAHRLKLPVVLHLVRLHAEFLEFYKRHPEFHSVKTVVHGFNKSVALASKFLDYGILLSFGSDLLKSPNLQACFLNMPMSHILLETDDQTKISIESVYAKAALIKAITITDLKLVIFNNLDKISDS